MNRKTRVRRWRPLGCIVSGLFLGFLGCDKTNSIARDAIVASANAYCSYSWYCDNTNANSAYNLFSGGTWYAGVAYNWGGWDTLAQFQSKIDSGKIAGDCIVCPFPVPSEHLGWAGVDCSGFVARCWGMTGSKPGTSTLPKYCTAIGWTDLQQGDLLNWPGHHAQLFDSFTGGTNQVHVYEATVKQGEGMSATLGMVQTNVCSRDNNYIPWKYNGVRENAMVSTAQPTAATNVASTDSAMNATKGETVANPVVRGDGKSVNKYHSADISHDNKIQLSELMRVVQFFTMNGYGCDTGGATADGYVPGAGGDRSCRRYAGDYDAVAWKISLQELLRLVQFFTMGAYRACPGDGTLDGYCPGEQR